MCHHGSSPLSETRLYMLSTLIGWEITNGLLEVFESSRALSSQADTNANQLGMASMRTGICSAFVEETMKSSSF